MVSFDWVLVRSHAANRSACRHVFVVNSRGSSLEVISRSQHRSGRRGRRYEDTIATADYGIQIVPASDVRRS